MEKTKTGITIFGLILVLIINASLVTLIPAVNAAIETDTYAFLSVAPNPIGVGQTLGINMWLANIPMLDEQNWAIPWTDYELTITKPDQSIQTLGPFSSDAVGNKYVSYTPDQIGTYAMQFNFPGQTVTGGSFFIPAGTYNYKPSASPIVELIVQQEPIERIPDATLPTDYWERPINSENREWYGIAGNWLMPYYDGKEISFNPYTTAPKTGHIVWTKSITFGGIIGGDYGTTSYYTGESYESKWSPIVMQGRLYYNLRLGASAWDGVACVDIRTGEQIWYKNYTVDFGQIYDYESPNQHGGIPYLWSISGSTWKMYDAFTGNWILDIENVPRGKNTFGPTGEILVYILDGRNNWLAMWNSTSIPELLGGATGTNAWQWRPPQGATLDGTKGIQWNVTITDVPGSPSLQKIVPDLILASTTFPATETQSQPIYEDVGYSIKPGEEGKLLWVQNRTVEASTTLGLAAARGSVMDEGVYTALMKETMQWYGYDAYTGDQIWITEPYENAWGFYQMGAGAIAYGKFYHACFDGRVHAFDLETGTEEWTYYSGSSGLETPYGHNPFCSGITGAYPTVTVADGQIFAVNNEHSPSMPLYKGYKLHVIDAETGNGIWNITGWYQLPLIADGYVVANNIADNRIYCFGKGVTKTTVSGPEIVQPLGTKVLIEGSVTDESPGTKSSLLTARFPNGVPAIADEYMSEWMEYLYMQQPLPAIETIPVPEDEVKGVIVKLTAIDPNGNFQDIGETVTDLNGNFGITWTPPVPGEYHVTATFEGSNSYWSSDATTYFAVTEAPSAAQPIQPEPTEPTGAPLISTETTIILAVVVIAGVIGIIAFWALRKQR